MASTRSGAAAVATTKQCPGRNPYHTLLTSQGSIYQAWQSRIMYYHWKKQATADGPCTDMTGFTRIMATAGGKPDGLESEMPSVFTVEYTPDEIAKYGHFGVLNRPYSVQQWLDQGGLGRIPEAYVYIAETDHVLMRPLPNLAVKYGKPCAFSFGYMYASSGVQTYVDLVAPGTSWRKLQPVGPSPVLLSKTDLIAITPRWLEYSLKLKLDENADKRFGWVLEMWGYAIAAASLGIEHEVTNLWQVEGATVSARSAYDRGVYIFHYTYGIEYRLDGKPQGPNQIGEWSLDKRHYGAAYPPRKLQAPPKGAADGAMWLCNAWNEASANIATWPATRALGTVGWRRNKGDGIAGSALASKVLNTRWKWATIPGLEFKAGGELKTPWSNGMWGALPEGVDYNDDGFCKLGCLFADFGGALHNIRFDRDIQTFKSWRVGDAESVSGVRVP